jgi:hypothetical protein
MLLKILYFIVVIVIIRAAMHMFRLLFSSPQSRSRVSKDRKAGDPVNGKRVIDVEFTEDGQDEERH